MKSKSKLLLKVVRKIVVIYESELVYVATLQLWPRIIVAINRLWDIPLQSIVLGSLQMCISLYSL